MGYAAGPTNLIISVKIQILCNVQCTNKKCRQLLL